MMDAIDFLNSDIMELPKERPDGDFLEFARGLFSQFQQQIRCVSNDKIVDLAITSRINIVDQVSTGLLTVLEAYFSGHPSLAYSRLENVLNILGPHFDALCPIHDMSTLVNPMFRMRPLDVATFTRGDLFHIPFEMRHKVGPMRYSISGLPSLYLGGSTQVCWRELGEPGLQTMSVSRYEAIPQTNLKIINFGWRPTRHAAHVATFPQEFAAIGPGTARIGAVVATWPLLALCSIKKRHPDARFHAEYILPQLVLQWITHNRQYHGIRYFSTHYREYLDDPKSEMNYVFPARQIASNGHCRDLTGLFKMTDPIAWSDAAVRTAQIGQRPRYKVRGQLLADLEQKFGQVEDVLLTAPVSFV